jgi:prepilin-type N-terminal cleavage/methylation domain-containing protein
MDIPLSAGNNFKIGSRLADNRKSLGFTLIELMITMVIAAILIALAAPTYNSFVQKRELTAVAEGIKSFIDTARQEAVKRNEEVTVSWYSAGVHSTRWCIGLSVGTDHCNCMQTTVTECVIDSVPYRLWQPDFPRAGTQFLHAEPDETTKAFFSFDPVRGVLDIDNLHSELVSRIDNENYIFLVHSDTRDTNDSGNSRWYELQMKLSYTGRFTICTDASNKRIIGGFPEC